MYGHTSYTCMLCVWLIYVILPGIRKLLILTKIAYTHQNKLRTTSKRGYNFFLIVKNRGNEFLVYSHFNLAHRLTVHATEAFHSHEIHGCHVKSVRNMLFWPFFSGQLARPWTCYRDILYILYYIYEIFHSIQDCWGSFLRFFEIHWDFFWLY
jgi:hypothetical protein